MLFDNRMRHTGRTVLNIMANQIGTSYDNEERLPYPGYISEIDVTTGNLVHRELHTYGDAQRAIDSGYDIQTLEETNNYQAVTGVDTLGDMSAQQGVNTDVVAMPDTYLGEDAYGTLSTSITDTLDNEPRELYNFILGKYMEYRYDMGERFDIGDLNLTHDEFIRRFKDFKFSSLASEPVEVY